MECFGHLGRNGTELTTLGLTASNFIIEFLKTKNY
jgi:hypothetical protein